MEVIEYFDLEESEARGIVSEAAAATAAWADRARAQGIAREEISFMRSVFEHEDLELALSF